MDHLFVDDQRTMLPGLMMSLKSDIMDCKVAWCRFASSKKERLLRSSHKHIIFEMHFVLTGKIIYDFSKLGRVTARQGHFMLIPQGVTHTTIDGEPGSTEYLVIAFLPSSAHPVINAIFSAESAPLALPFSGSMESLIKALKRKAQNENFTTGLSTKLIIHSILLETVDCIAEHLHLNHLREQIPNPSDPRASQIVRIVNENLYHQKLRGEEIAARLGITTRQLNRISNQLFGCSINQYIIRCRIQGMQTLLRESSYTIADISDIFGFSDAYAFIKHFTHFAGITPGSYRKSQNAVAVGEDGTYGGGTRSSASAAK